VSERYPTALSTPRIIHRGATKPVPVISDTIRAMFSAESTASFSPKAVCDTSKALEVLNCLTLDSRAEVDEMIRKAVAAGGTVFEEAEDH
jgi:predicted lactoylglutathione lyase